MSTRSCNLLRNVALCALLCTLEANASTRNLADCAFTTVDNFINHGTPTGFSAGDTVTCPPGTWTWDSTLSITVGMTLAGNGIDSTIIKSSSSTPMIKYSPGNPGLNENLRLTGFTLDGVGANVTLVYISNSSTATTLDKLRIDHNKLISAYRGIQIEGMICGLVDNNILQAAGVFYITGRDGYSWAVPLQIGTASSLYIEDNIISGPAGFYIIQSSMGARWVFRYNTIDMAGAGFPVLDAHGNLSYDTSNVPSSCALDKNQRGVIGTEIYENKFNDINGVTSIYDHRGGTSFVFNNTSGGTVLGCNFDIHVREEDNNPGIGLCYPLKLTYPGWDPVIDTYIWNNRRNDGQPICFNNYDADLMIIEKQDYWADTQSGGSLSTTYFTSGLATARPNVCSAGDVFWETDTKRLLRCVEANNWTFIYTPFTYPHPFQTQLASPTNLRTVNP